MHHLDHLDHFDHLHYLDHLDHLDYLDHLDEDEEKINQSITHDLITPHPNLLRLPSLPVDLIWS